MNRHLFRILCMLIASIFCSNIASAQSMKVVSFNKLEGDITANVQGTSRKSTQDGKNAALIKVVTSEKDFNFSGGTFSIVDVVQKPGEIWVYVPSRAQKISIAHDRFGRLNDYYFPVALEPGSTYEMVLDPGQGKYAIIQTAVPHSPVWLDGDSIGVSPIKNAYIFYGKHKLTSKKGRNEGELEISVINDGEDNLLTFDIPMVDQSIHYGRVTVTAEPGVEIYMDGKLLNIGQWTDELYEGSYDIETRKLNCDPAKTHFVVEPQKNNQVKANLPTPHKGYLSLYTRPGSPKVQLDTRDTVLVERYELPVGKHTIDLAHKGYYDFSKEYDIKHNVTVYDTINMTHVQYVTPNGFYFGGAGTVGTFMGGTALIGGRVKNIDLQLSYMFGLNKSNPVNYYNTETGQFLGTAEYSLSIISAKLGYQIAFSPVFGLTPQVGFAAHMLSGTTLRNKVPEKDINAACATVGARFVYAPMQHLSLFLAPEYDVAVSKGRQYTDIADAAGFSAGGFFCNLGFLINF